jgi:hypothetical protein
VAEFGEMVDGPVHGVVGNIVGGGLGAKQEMVPNIQFDEPVAVVATDDGIAQFKILDHSLQLTLIVFGDLAAENRGDLAGLADGTVGIQKFLVQLIECGPPVKNQVVTILYLGEKEPVLAAASFAFAFFKEWSQTG